MRNLFKFAGVFLLGSVLALNVACSSDDDGPGDQLGRIGTMSMKIDGKLWEADVATVMTISDEDTEAVGEDVGYFVTMTGVKTVNSGSDEVAESISMSLLLTEVGFNNPKRSYPAANMSETDYGHGIIIFNNQAEIETVGRGVYISTYPKDSDQAVGNITVKDYEIGNQSFFGQLLGKGYTKLSGTFDAELYSYDD